MRERAADGEWEEGLICAVVGEMLKFIPDLQSGDVIVIVGQNSGSAGQS